MLDDMFLSDGMCIYIVKISRRRLIRPKAIGGRAFVTVFAGN
jgi:hypothetical protein